MRLQVIRGYLFLLPRLTRIRHPEGMNGKSDTVANLARQLGMDRRILDAEIRRGRLRAHKIGRSVRVLDHDLQEWLNATVIKDDRFKAA